MSTDLAVIDHRGAAPLTRTADDPPVVITNEQAALVKATLAADATDAELQLFFYDCRRRGVHPLDKLIHFTKRKGKYTPVTSIDFFRSRAAKTREHMGTEDVVYTGVLGDPGFAATVKVYRLVCGEKCPFVATARMDEYLPDPPNDFMWQKMPYGQLGKCAEALALRKGFPQELADLHIVEELERASGEAAPPQKTVRRASEKTESAAPAGALVTAPLKVKDVRVWGKDKNNYAVTLIGDRNEYTTKDPQVAIELEKFKGTDHLVRLTFTDNQSGDKVWHNIKSFEVVEPAAATSAAEPAPAAAAPLTSDQIPFGK